MLLVCQITFMFNCLLVLCMLAMALCCKDARLGVGNTSVSDMGTPHRLQFSTSLDIRV